MCRVVCVCKKQHTYLTRRQPASLPVFSFFFFFINVQNANWTWLSVCFPLHLVCATLFNLIPWIIHHFLLEITYPCPVNPCKEEKEKKKRLPSLTLHVYINAEIFIRHTWFAFLFAGFPNVWDIFLHFIVSALFMKGDRWVPSWFGWSESSQRLSN